MKKVNTDDCWLWAMKQNYLGYGIYPIKIDGKRRWRQAHRLMYENLVGPIPEGLVIDHLCRVPTCVNPDHLEAVTVRENNMRGLLSALKPPFEYCQRGHKITEANTKYNKDINGTVYKACRTCRNAANSALWYRTHPSKRPWVKLTTEQRCWDCKTIKPLDEFHKDRSTPRGVTRRCKECFKIRDAARKIQAGQEGGDDA